MSAEIDPFPTIARLQASGELAKIVAGEQPASNGAAPDSVFESRTLIPGGAFILDAPDSPPAIWGEGEDVLWAAGEPLMICGPQGIGKTTVGQQLALARIGVLHPTLLNFPVVVDDRPVVYIAADRPSQAARSMHRMVDESDRETLDERLIVQRGPLPFNVVDNPRQFGDWLEAMGAGAVFIDSVKDFAIGITDDAVGAAVNQAMQDTIARGIEVVSLHHQRKAQGDRKPKALADVYGSTWITAGQGSVVLLWGEPGDSFVEMTHLKQPMNDVGPLTIRHDHDAGRSTVPDAIDLLDLAMYGVTVNDAADKIHGKTTGRNEREKVRRRLGKLAKAGKVIPEPSSEPGGPTTYWHHLAEKRA